MTMNLKNLSAAIFIALFPTGNQAKAGDSANLVLRVVEAWKESTKLEKAEKAKEAASKAKEAVDAAIATPDAARVIEKTMASPAKTYTSEEQRSRVDTMAAFLCAADQTETGGGGCELATQTLKKVKPIAVQTNNLNRIIEDTGRIKSFGERNLELQRQMEASEKEFQDDVRQAQSPPENANFQWLPDLKKVATETASEVGAGINKGIDALVKTESFKSISASISNITITIPQFLSPQGSSPEVPTTECPDGVRNDCTSDPEKEPSKGRAWKLTSMQSYMGNAAEALYAGERRCHEIGNNISEITKYFDKSGLGGKCEVSENIIDEHNSKTIKHCKDGKAEQKEEVEISVSAETVTVNSALFSDDHYANKGTYKSSFKYERCEP